MKSSSFGISAIFCLGLFAGTVLAEEGGVQAFDRSTACLTARLLLERVREDVLKEAQPAETLMSAMTNAPGTYVRTAEAREALRPVYRQAVEAQYAKEAGAVLDKLAKGASREDAFGADFAQAAVLLPADRVDAAVRRDYDRQFQAARKQACALQRNAIVANLRPTEQEFETTDRQALKTKLSDRIIAGQTFPVFEENRPYISNEIVEPMLRAAEVQRNEQRDWLQQSRLEHWTPARMERELRDGLQTHSATVSKQRTEKGEIAYGLFPSVVAGIPEVAQKRAAERLARTIRETQIQTMPVDFLAVIEKNPGAHRTREDSLKAFRPALTETLQKQTLERVPSLVPEAERAEFTAWANTCFAQHDETRKTVSEVVDHVLMPQVENAIRRLAEACGAVTRESQQDGTEKLCTLKKVLGLPELKDALDETLLFNIRVFYARTDEEGMRDLVAHGMLSDEEWQFDRSLMVWWFTLKLCCLFCGEYQRFFEREGERAEKE